MPRIDSLLVALTPTELADFLPAPALTAPRVHLIDPATLPAALAAHDPDVLLACWKTSPLPADSRLASLSRAPSFSRCFARFDPLFPLHEQETRPPETTRARPG